MNNVDTFAILALFGISWDDVADADWIGDEDGFDCEIATDRVVVQLHTYMDSDLGPDVDAVEIEWIGGKKPLHVK